MPEGWLSPTRGYRISSWIEWNIVLDNEISSWKIVEDRLKPERNIVMDRRENRHGSGWNIVMDRREIPSWIGMKYRHVPEWNIVMYRSGISSCTRMEYRHGSAWNIVLDRDGISSWIGMEYRHGPGRISSWISTVSVQISSWDLVPVYRGGSSYVTQNIVICYMTISE